MATRGNEGYPLFHDQSPVFWAVKFIQVLQIYQVNPRGVQRSSFLGYLFDSIHTAACKCIFLLLEVCKLLQQGVKKGHSSLLRVVHMQAIQDVKQWKRSEVDLESCRIEKHGR